MSNYNSYDYMSNSSYTPPSSSFSSSKVNYDQSAYDSSWDANRGAASGYSKSRWDNNGLSGSQYKLEPRSDDFLGKYNNNSSNTFYGDYKNVKKLPEESSSMRMTFDVRSNNRIKDMISKYDTEDAGNSKYESSKYDKYDKSAEIYSPKANLDKGKYRNADLEDKLRKYSETYDKFSDQLESTSKVSKQIERLKELRSKRQQEAKQKEESEYALTNSYSSTNIGANYKSQAPTSITNSKYDKYDKYDKYKAYEPKETPKEEVEPFKKKKTYEIDSPYSPKYEKKNYTDYTSPTSIVDKYKTKDYDIESKYKNYSTSTNIPSAPSSSYNVKSVSSPSSKKSEAVQYVEVNNFILGKSLGEGKFGIVYQATHKPTGWLYAIKKVPKEMIKSHYMIDQFILELKLQAFLYHENILTLFTCFDDKNAVYLVLEYMEEGTLFTHLKKNKTLPEAEVAQKIRQIASAVKYLHENQIAHRDIKPENIVMSHGVCKLCDFGWSTICDDRRKTYCGTFDYAPPEILQGVEYDYTVDLWCLGVLTYELLVGKAPFYHISRKETMKKILNVEFTTIEYPENLSKTAVAFIDNLLKKDPKERLSSDMLLEHPFLKNAEKPAIKY